MSNAEFDRIARDLRGRSGRTGTYLLFAVGLVLMSVGYWAHLTEIDDVTRADARVAPSQLVQVVQAAETGTITEIGVKVGDIVEPGDVIMRLDPTLLHSELNTAQADAAALFIRQNRLKSQISGTDFNMITEPETQDILDAEHQLFLSLQEQLFADLLVLEARRDIKMAEIKGAEVGRDVAEENIALLLEEIKVVEPLVEKRIESPLALISLRRQFAELNGRLRETETQIVMAQTAVTEIESQIVARKRDQLTKAHQELTEVHARLASLETRIPALQTRLKRAEIRSPTRGIVNQVLFATLGGVAQQGQTVAEIVPFGDTVTVEAFVDPADIAFIRPNQEVKVRITAYDASRYGALDGAVTRIGADTVEAPDGERSVYVVEIRLQGTLTDADGVELEIIPGMIAQVDMLSQKKTVLAYLTQPVVRIKDRAFRD